MKLTKKINARRSLVMLVFLVTMIPMVFADNSWNVIASQPDISNSGDSELLTSSALPSELTFFDPGDFFNGSHSVDVSRTIHVNRWGQVTVRDTFRIFNNGTKQINAFNLTVPNSELKDTLFFDVNSNETGKFEYKPIAEPGSKNTVFLIQTKDIVPGQSYFFEMVSVNPSIISKAYETIILKDYPYNFNASFLPWISIPITNFTFKADFGSIETGNFEFDNTTVKISPEETNVEYKKELRSFEYKLSQVSTIDQGLLSDAGFGGYNQTKIAGIPFIPAYTPLLEKNLTFSVTVDFIPYAHSFLEYTSVDVTVVVDPWGGTTTTEKIVIKNTAARSGDIWKTEIGGIDSITPVLNFYAPDKAKIKSVRDTFGNLSVQVTREANPNRTRIRLDPRIEIASGSSYSFTLVYKQDNENVVNQTEKFDLFRFGSGFRLVTPLMSQFNWTVKQFHLSIILPSGASYDRDSVMEQFPTAKFSNEPGLLFLENKPVINVELSDLCSFHNTNMNINFRVSPLVIFWSPLIISLLFLLIFGGYAIIRNLSYGVSPIAATTKDEIPINLIQAFVKAYEEKTAIRERIRRLQRRRAQKRLTKKEFDKANRILLAKGSEVEREIVNKSRSLSEAGSRYRSAMRAIEIAEAEREDVLINIESLEKKRSQGRIGEESFRALRLDYDKRLKRGDNAIDKALIELRSLLTK